MPEINQPVKFRFGTYETLPENRDDNTLYFVTDKMRIFVGSDEYTRPVLSGVSAPTSLTLVFPKDTIYIQDTGDAQSIWYYAYNSSTGNYAWKQVSSLDDVMTLAKLDTTAADVKNIKAGQLYKYDGWVSLKLISNSEASNSFMKLVDTGKAAQQINSEADHDHYATAAAVYMWNRKFIEQPQSWELPQMLSAIGDYDPLGVVFSTDVNSTGVREYYLCIYRDEIDNEFKNMIYVRFPTMDELEDAIAEVNANAILKLESDPISGYKTQDNATVGVLNQVVYSISSNSLFKCTTRGGPSTNPYMTWTKLHTTANVTYWDYLVSHDNNFEVPTTFAGEVGDIVVMTTAQGTYDQVRGGEIWQCYKIIVNIFSGLRTYLWRIINQSIRCSWDTAVPTTETASDLWDIRYVQVNGKIRAYQLTSKTYNSGTDTHDYNWTRLLTEDDYGDTIIANSGAPVDGQVSQGATMGLYNQVLYDYTGKTFYRCTTSAAVYNAPNDRYVEWTMISRQVAVTVWDAATSASHNYTVPTSQAGQIGDVIVLTPQNVSGTGGRIWQLLRTVSAYGSTTYIWEEISFGDGYLSAIPTTSTEGDRWDVKWVLVDGEYRCYQLVDIHPGNPTSYIWINLITPGALIADLSAVTFSTEGAPSALAVKTYVDNKIGVPYVNPDTGKVTIYENGVYHDEDYGPENQLYIKFNVNNTGQVFIQKDAYNSEGVSNVHLMREEEMSVYELLPPTFDNTYNPSYQPSYSAGQLFWFSVGNPRLCIMNRFSGYSQIAMASDLSNYAYFEQGTIYDDNYALYSNEEDGYVMEGSYSLIGDMCFLRASAYLVSGWERVYYYLPVAAGDSGSCIALQGSNFFTVATGTQNDTSVLEIKQIGSQYMVGGKIYFTLVYKYEN